MEGCQWRIKWERNIKGKIMDVCADDFSGLAMAGANWRPSNKYDLISQALHKLFEMQRTLNLF